MKSNFLRQKMLLLVLMITTAVNSYAQQKITVTATYPGNILCNNTCVQLDIPDLNNNKDAIIISVTPELENGVNPNPWTISVGYNLYNDYKWVIRNMGNQSIKKLTKFDIVYYAHPDTNQFVDVIAEYLSIEEGSVIDHAGMNNNPNAKFQFIQNVTPQSGHMFNLIDVLIRYNMKIGRWCIYNYDNTKVQRGAAYNIAISSGLADIKNIGGKDTLLNGIGVKNISTKLPPAVGQVLKWNGTEWAPGNDSTCCTANNNNAVAGWSMSGGQLYSTNQGFVGIAWKTPNAPLGFSPSLGKKISLYPGATGDAGFGVAPNRLQIFSDNPNADVAIGYDAAGTFNERFAIKANGTLAVNGNSGQPGQVLQSNGPNAPASWQNGAGGIQSFMHFVPRVFSTDTTLIYDDMFPNTIHVTQNSTLVISATFVGLGHTFVLDNEAQLVDIRINGVTQNINLVLVAAPRSEGSATISNYLYNALPGNYDIEFVSKRTSAYNSLSEISVKLSSVLVLPNNTATNTNIPAIK